MRMARASREEFTSSKSVIEIDGTRAPSGFRHLVGLHFVLDITFATEDILQRSGYPRDQRILGRLRTTLRRGLVSKH